MSKSAILYQIVFAKIHLLDMDSVTENYLMYLNVSAQIEHIVTEKQVDIKHERRRKSGKQFLSSSILENEVCYDSNNNKRNSVMMVTLSFI